MPSFLSKVFGRKKTDEKDKEKEPSTPSPLGGRFEAVRLSPSVANFGERRSNGATRASTEPHHKSLDAAPHLSLNLPSVKDDKHKALGLVFDGGVSLKTVLSDSAIGERRLSPSEAQLLVQACSEVIVSRGLETLGLMHPHWHSASPDVQRKLISLFLNSLAAGSASTTLSSPLSEFHSELGFTRTPQDVAAVLRWGLRHLKLEGSQFGQSSAWYYDFYQAEASANYPPKAYSTILTPLIPSPHVQLLSTLLNLAAYIAAHAEANGISGSKLSKFIGLWVLTSEHHRPSDDWKTFYARWEAAGRQLEHIFLSYIRDEAADRPVPRRLSELVQQYPYSASKDMDLLPPPRFSTRQYDALLLQIQTTLPGFKTLRSSPLQLITEALRAQLSASSGSQPHEVWQQIKVAAGEGEPDIFADESIRMLSLTASSDQPLSPTFRDLARRGSHPASEASNSHIRTPSSEDSHMLSSTSSYQALGAADWAQFSQSGFLDSPSLGTPLAATLMDKDVEVTEPPATSLKRSMSRKSTASTIRNRKSMDNPPPVPSIPASVINAERDDPPKPTSIVTGASLAQIDEAFIDFWHDALIDPISSTWPNFVLAKLKHSIATQLKLNGKTIEWVIIEQTFTKPPPPPAPAPLIIPSVSQQTTASATTSSPGSRRPAPSPKSSQRSDTSKKRFSFFSTRTSSDRGTKKKGSKSPVVGELGEILPDAPSSASRETKLSTVGENVVSGAVAGAAGLAVGAGAVATVAAVSDATAPEPILDKTPTPEQASEPEIDAMVTEDPAPVVLAQTTTEPEGVVEQPTVAVQEPSVMAEPMKPESMHIAEEPTAEEPIKDGTLPATNPIQPFAEEPSYTARILASAESMPEEPTQESIKVEEPPLVAEKPICTPIADQPSVPPTSLESSQESREAIFTSEPAPAESAPSPTPPVSEVTLTQEPVAEVPEVAPTVEVSSASVPDVPQEVVRGPTAVEESTQSGTAVAVKEEALSAQPLNEPTASTAVAEAQPQGTETTQGSVPLDTLFTDEPKAENSTEAVATESPRLDTPEIKPVESAPVGEGTAIEEPEPTAPTDEPSPDPEGSVEPDVPAVPAPQTISEPQLEQVTPQVEPLSISPTAGDEAVALPEVPVVQAEPEAPTLAIPIEAVSEPAPVAEVPPPNEVEADETASVPPAVEHIIASGETPGPQAMLSAADAPTESEAAGKLDEPDEIIALPVTPKSVEPEEAVAPLTFTSAPVDDGSPPKSPTQLAPVGPEADAKSLANANKAE